MKRASTGLALLLLSSLCIAGDEPSWRSRWERRGPPLTKRLVIVLDVSGSMRGRPLDRARGELLTIVSLFPDEGYLRAYAFDARVTQFAAHWRHLPDGALLEELSLWLDGFPGTGSTALGSAVATALGHEEDDLSVVLITDGDPTGDDADHLAEIETAQRARVAGRAPIHVVALFEKEPGSDARELVARIAKAHGGSLVTIIRGPPLSTPH